MKKNLIFISIPFIIFVFCLCFFLYPEINLVSYPLSHFGTLQKTGIIFGFGLSLCCILNIVYLFNMIDKIALSKQKSIFVKALVILTEGALINSSVFPMDKFEVLHNIGAFTFYFGSIIIICFIGFYYRKKDKQIFNYSIILSILSLVLSYTSTYTYGLSAVTEIACFTPLAIWMFIMRVKLWDFKFKFDKFFKINEKNI